MFRRQVKEAAKLLGFVVSASMLAKAGREGETMDNQGAQIPSNAEVRDRSAEGPRRRLPGTVVPSSALGSPVSRLIQYSTVAGTCMLISLGRSHLFL